MLSVIRRAVAVASLMVVSASAAQAQIELREIRIDLASFYTVDGNTALTLGGPTNRIAGMIGSPVSVALGVYLNDKIALEPSFSIVNFSPDVGDATTFISFGLAAPYYLQSGKAGLFVSPNLDIIKATDVDAQIDFGADVGYKKAINDNLSWRAAGGFRTGDTTNDELALIATFGFSWFLK